MEDPNITYELNWCGRIVNKCPMLYDNMSKGVLIVFLILIIAGIILFPFSLIGISIYLAVAGNFNVHGNYLRKKSHDYNDDNEVVRGLNRYLNGSFSALTIFAIIIGIILCFFIICSGVRYCQKNKICDRSAKCLFYKKVQRNEVHENVLNQIVNRPEPVDQV